MNDTDGDDNNGCDDRDDYLLLLLLHDYDCHHHRNNLPESGDKSIQKLGHERKKTKKEDQVIKFSFLPR